MRATRLKQVAGVLLLSLCAGCGIGVQIFGVPTTTTPGQPVNFQVKLTNHAICPAQSVAFIAAFVPNQIITSSPTGQEFVDLFCNGSLTIGTEQCTLDGDVITCNTAVVTPGPFAPPATTQNFTLTLPGLPAPIPCTESGSTIQCQIPAADQQALTAAGSNEMSRHAAPPVSCFPGGPLSFVCLPPQLSAGAMTTFNLTLPAPALSGTLRTIVIEEQTNGVCQGGTSQGAPCGGVLGSSCAGG